jgi:hypothetical protein
MYDFLNPDNRDEVIRDWVTQDYNDIEREVGFNVRSLYFRDIAQPDYAWPTIEDYEKEVGFEVNDAFKAAWTMARTTNDLFKQMGETK